MSWVGPTAKKATMLGARYGPHVVAAWRVGGKQVQAAAQSAKDDYTARRSAVEHAETVVDGTVLKTIHTGTKVWVVFAGDKPVACYPEGSTSLEDLIADADLTKRRTPQQIREQAVRARAKRATQSAPHRAKGLARDVKERRSQRKAGD